MRYDDRLVWRYAERPHVPRRVSLILLLLALLFGLPLTGVVLGGGSPRSYFTFPPPTGTFAHAPFSWAVFVALSFAACGFVLPFVLRVARARASFSRAPFPFPVWGWCGVGLLCATWILAWGRFSWFSLLQPYTFAPLWLGYILVVNALTARRIGRCLLGDRPKQFLALFPISAAFWWFFEYLNRFVQNWHYVGVADLTPTVYFWHATVAFSTVLPAVLSTRDWFATFPRLEAGLRRFVPIRPSHPRALAAAVLLIACAALAAIGVWPDYLFAFLWLAPLFMIASLQALFGEATVFSPVRYGDWRLVVIPALAALFCGFFWELWNWRSFAHWEYAIPFVDRFPLFEMPILGYAGYLPFGVECIAVVSLFFPLQVVREVVSTAPDKVEHARRARSS